MPFDWKAIYETEDPEARLYRLIGEMHSKRAGRSDLTNLREFLSAQRLGADTWQTLGESLHRCTQGAETSFRIWAAWTNSLADDDLQEVRGNLQSIWEGFGDTSPRPPVIESDDETPTDVVEIEIHDPSENTGPSNTAVIRFPRPRLMEFVPQGHYNIRFLGDLFENVDENAIVNLLRRGLLLGAEVEHNGGWVKVPDHPAFEQLTEVMLEEVRRLLLDSSLSDDKSAVTTSVV